VFCFYIFLETRDSGITYIFLETRDSGILGFLFSHFEDLQCRRNCEISCKINVNDFAE